MARAFAPIPLGAETVVKAATSGWECDCGGAVLT